MSGRECTCRTVEPFGGRRGLDPTGCPLHDVRLVMREARKLERAIIRYSQDRAQSAGVRSVEAIRWMNEHPEVVAKDLDVSPEFVTVWSELELKRAKT